MVSQNSPQTPPPRRSLFSLFWKPSATLSQTLCNCAKVHTRLFFFLSSFLFPFSLSTLSSQCFRPVAYWLLDSWTRIRSSQLPIPKSHAITQAGQALKSKQKKDARSAFGYSPTQAGNGRFHVCLAVQTNSRLGSAVSGKTYRGSQTYRTLRSLRRTSVMCGGIGDGGSQPSATSERARVREQSKERKRNKKSYISIGGGRSETAIAAKVVHLCVGCVWENVDAVEKHGFLFKFKNIQKSYTT